MVAPKAYKKFSGRRLQQARAVHHHPPPYTTIYSATLFLLLQQGPTKQNRTSKPKNNYGCVCPAAAAAAYCDPFTL